MKEEDYELCDNVLECLELFTNNVQETEVLLLYIPDRKNRSLVHEWCRNKNIFSVGCYYIDWPENHMAICSNCHKIENENNLVNDEGSFWESCRSCKSIRRWDSSGDDVYNTEGFYGFKTFESLNGILISHKSHVLNTFRERFGCRGKKKKIYIQMDHILLNNSLGCLKCKRVLFKPIQEVSTKILTPKHRRISTN